MAVVDAQIFPHATGPAAKLVEKHKSPQPLKFYSGWFCPFVQRAWIALEEKKIPYEYVEINPYHKAPEFLAINPKGLVPAVEYDGTALYESLVLCEFFEEKYPEHQPRILPNDPVKRAVARIWIDYVAKSILPPFFRLLQSQEEDKRAEALQEYIKSVSEFSKQIKGPYFLGEEFSLVDIAIAPWIVRDYVIQENRGFNRSNVSENWEAYAAKVEARDSVKDTSSDRVHYDQIYTRYLKNEAQSEAAKAIRSGRAIP